MFPYLIICVTHFLFSLATATEFAPCNSGPAPISVDINGCDKPPCTLTKGTNMSWSIEFTADSDHTEVLCGFEATFMGFSYGYPGVDGVISCDNIYSVPDHKKVGCPLQKGKMYRHELKIVHNMPAPKITLPVSYSLKDKTTNLDFVCCKILVSVN